MRFPWAAHTLLQQVQKVKPNAKMTGDSEPDGLRVVREVKFDKRTSDWLAPILDHVHDERITDHWVTDAGYLHILFSPGPDADERTRFPLRQAEALIEPEPEPEPDEDFRDSEVSEITQQNEE